MYRAFSELATCYFAQQIGRRIHFGDGLFIHSGRILLPVQGWLELRIRRDVLWFFALVSEGRGDRMELRLIQSE